MSRELNEKMLGELQSRLLRNPEVKECGIFNYFLDKDITDLLPLAFKFNSDGTWTGEIYNLTIGYNPNWNGYSPVFHPILEERLVREIKTEVLRYCYDSGFEVFADFSGNPFGIIPKRDEFEGSPLAATFDTYMTSNRNAVKLYLERGGGTYNCIDCSSGRAVISGGSPRIRFPKNVYNPFGEWITASEGATYLELPRWSGCEGKK